MVKQMGEHCEDVKIKKVESKGNGEIDIHTTITMKQEKIEQHFKLP